MQSGYRFNFLHFMAYTHLPANHREFDSLWVNFPNSYSDPHVAHELYQQYISEMVLADKLGFDALVVTEHHNNLEMPTPCLIAAALIPQTVNAKICVWGTPPNLTYPNRLAEEYAVLDVLSKGRLEVAFPLGTGMEYWANSVNPVTLRERHRESIEIILKAWTVPGPTSHFGEFYSYRFLNIWPRTFQRPHPPCYIVGSGSPETIELAAELGFGYSSVFVSRQRTRQLNEMMRERSAAHGHTLRPEQLPLGVMIYVAETEQQAEQEYLGHLRFFFENILRTTPHFLTPPGYLSLEQARARAGGDKMHGVFNLEALKAQLFIAIGTPEQVANQLGEWGEEMGTNHFNLYARLGDMPHWKAVKNLSLIAEEVIPRLRKRSAASSRQSAVG